MVDAGALRMNRSPGCAFSKAYCTSDTDSSSDIRNRVIFGLVMVIGLPARTCSTNNGITEPREYMTLPYRVTDTVVEDSGWLRANAIATRSIMALLMPIALTG